MRNTIAQTNSFRESLDRLRPDVHSCLIYETPEEQVAATAPLMELGLTRGEKCIYLSDETNTGGVLAAMRERGIDINSAIQSGALTVIPSRTTQGGSPTAATLDLLAQAGRAANGTAVRLAREVTCAPGEVVGQKQVEEYNRQVAECFTGKKYTDVALYNKKRVQPQVLLNVIRENPVVIWDGTVCDNLHATRTGERLSPDPTALEVERVLANLRDRQRIEDGLRGQVRNAAFVPVESLLSGSPSPASPQSGCGTCLSHISTLQEQILHTEKMEALGRMATGMVTEFRKALTAILGSTEMLIDRMAPDDSRLNLAQQILKASQDATALTNQLLDFSQPAKIQPELLDLNSAVSELEEVLRCSLTTQTDLRFVPASAPCPVKIDRGQLEQVLLNLVLNARDAMGDRGAITIKTALTFKNMEGTVRPGSRVEPVVTLSVTDTGLGMDTSTRERAFDPFFTTKDPGQGPGLGLSTVYGIVQQQFGGSISVESRAGKGTTVTIYFPLAGKLPD